MKAGEKPIRIAYRCVFKYFELLCVGSLSNNFISEFLHGSISKPFKNIEPSFRVTNLQASDKI